MKLAQKDPPQAQGGRWPNGNKPGRKPVWDSGVDDKPEHKNVDSDEEFKEIMTEQTTNQTYRTMLCDDFNLKANKKFQGRDLLFHAY